MTQAIQSILEKHAYTPDQYGIYRSGNEGYWSNLNQNENTAFITDLERTDTETAVKKHIPQFHDVIFSPQREAGLEFLDIKPGEVCIDFGCMWGALSVGMAKRGGQVISVDQTYSSLRFLNERKKHQNLDGVTCVQNDIRKINFERVADVAVLNGVLEWVPEFEAIELKNFYGKSAERAKTPSPEATQRDVLKMVQRTLKPGGRLMLAIENRFDFHQFIGKRDPHANLFFTSILPRPLANLLSRWQLKRDYVNYLYSFPHLKEILRETGFSRVEMYAVFPDYRFPRLILPYQSPWKGYSRPSSQNVSLKRKIVNLIEWVLMSGFKLKFFAPSIIAIATK